MELMADTMVWNFTLQEDKLVEEMVRIVNSQFRDTTTRVTTTTTRRQRRSGVNTRVVAQIDRESLGDRLRSTALIPFMRSKNINFVADGLKPNTRIYPFFDKVDVTNFVTPTSVSGQSDHQQNTLGGNGCSLMVVEV